MIWRDESGIAWGIAIFFIGIIALSFILSLMFYATNPLIESANDDITAGGVGARSRNAFYFNANIFTMVPGIVLIGMFIWLMVRAVYSKGTGI